MSETVLFESSSVRSRAEIADYLRAVADNLARGEDVTVRAGERAVTLSPPERCEFEVKVEREGPAGEGERSVEFELEWPERAEGASGDAGDLEIE